MAKTFPSTRKWQEGDKEDYIRRAEPLIGWLDRNVEDLKRLKMATSLLGYYLKRSTVTRAQRVEEDAMQVLADLKQVMRDLGANPYGLPKTSSARTELAGLKSKRR